MYEVRNRARSDMMEFEQAQGYGPCGSCKYGTTRLAGCGAECGVDAQSTRRTACRRARLSDSSARDEGLRRWEVDGCDALGRRPATQGKYLRDR